MYENLTYSRPYANAIFALAQKTQKLAECQTALFELAAVAETLKKLEVLNDPKINRDQLLELFLHDQKTHRNIFIENLLRLLVHNKRFKLLPEIAMLYQDLYHEQEKILVVKVTSAFELTPSQKQKISEKLAKRLQYKIELECFVDKKLIGGALIKIGDKITDGSTLGKLQQLREQLL